MSLKIFDSENIKNYTIINKNQKEKADLLENILLATSSEGIIHFVASSEEITHLTETLNSCQKSLSKWFSFVKILSVKIQIKQSFWVNLINMVLFF